MGIFGKILSKLGFGEAHSSDTTTSGTAKPASQPSASAQASPGSPAPSAAISPVDVVAKLESMAAQQPEKLNWRTSIVDLLKLLSLDSSLTARKELATELGCPPDKMADSAAMNTWLHKTVMQKLADNGGNIPPELRH